MTYTLIEDTSNAFVITIPILIMAIISFRLLQLNVKINGESQCKCNVKDEE